MLVRMRGEIAPVPASRSRKSARQGQPVAEASTITVPLTSTTPGPGAWMVTSATAWKELVSVTGWARSGPGPRAARTRPEGRKPPTVVAFPALAALVAFAALAATIAVVAL